jgi:hypothetical protein
VDPRTEPSPLVAGRGSCQHSSNAGSGDGGPATSAALEPYGLAFDSAGKPLYRRRAEQRRPQRVHEWRDHDSCRCRRYPLRRLFRRRRPRTSAQLQYPIGLAMDSAGNLYIADTFNFVVRRLSVSGTITTFAGNGTYGNSGDGGSPPARCWLLQGVAKSVRPAVSTSRMETTITSAKLSRMASSALSPAPAPLAITTLRALGHSRGQVGTSIWPIKSTILYAC